MHLRRLRLTGFRNHLETDITFEPGNVAITGGNGHGKSSLLEAVHLLSVGKSSRTSHYGELANHDIVANGGLSQVLGVFVEGDTTSRVQFDMTFAQPFAGSHQRNAQSSREWRIDGTTHKAIDVVGRANVVLFQVDDLDLVVGAASSRRRYLDILISQFDTEYKRSLLRIGHVRRSRVALLQGARAGANIEEDIVFWDERFRDESVKIILTRRDVLSQLGLHAEPAHRALSLGEPLTIRYTPALGPRARDLDPDGMDEESLSYALGAALTEVRHREVSSGRMVIGPHLDDFEIMLNGQPARHYASRGQSRTLALALRLAEAEMVKQHAGRTPVVLFDDVMSEMDPERRALILERTAAFDQTLMTATDEEALEVGNVQYAQRIRVADGGATVVG